MSKGAKKPKLRDYSNLRLSPEESQKLRDILLQLEQPSIVTAFLGTILVEHELDGLLRRRFKRNDKDNWEKLVSERGPLRSFDAKILCGYSFGLYDEKVMDDLNAIRQIRNGFAHSRLLLDFDDPLILKVLEGANLLRKRDKKFLAEKPTNKNIAKTCYITICQILMLKLVRRHARATVAAAKRLERRLSKLPFARAFRYGAPPLTAATVEYLRQFIPLKQSADPTLQPLGVPPVLLRELSKKDDKTGE